MVSTLEMNRVCLAWVGAQWHYTVAIGLKNKSCFAHTKYKYCYGSVYQSSLNVQCSLNDYFLT